MSLNSLEDIFIALGWEPELTDKASTQNWESIAPSIYGYGSTPCPCGICAAAVAGAAMSPRFPFNPNSKVEDFLVAPQRREPSTPNHKPDTRLDPGNGPVPPPAGWGRTRMRAAQSQDPFRPNPSAQAIFSTQKSLVSAPMREQAKPFTWTSTGTTQAIQPGIISKMLPTI